MKLEEIKIIQNKTKRYKTKQKNTSRIEKKTKNIGKDKWILKSEFVEELNTE